MAKQSGPWSHLYRTNRWRRARRIFLVQHPLCVLCKQMGRVAPATVVDHIVPHKGDLVVFWDVSRWRALCSSCHSGAVQAENLSGVLRGHGVDGYPLDESHPGFDQERGGTDGGE